MTAPENNPSARDDREPKVPADLAEALAAFGIVVPASWQEDEK